MKPFPFLVLSLAAIPVWAQNAVTVHVVDEKNAPVAGATVEVRVWEAEEKNLAPTTTDANGNATLSLPSKPDGKRAGAALSVAANGFAFTNAGVSGAKVEVHLQRGAVWRGQVVDEAGKPLAGTKISVSDAMSSDDFRGRLTVFGTKIPALYQAQSGADGRFQIADVPAQMNLLYNVSRAGFAAVRGVDGTAQSEEIIKMVPGGALRGRLLDAAGKPLAKIRVYASGDGIGWGETLTDVSGAFRIESLSKGEYRVGVELPPNAPYVMPRRIKVSVEAGKTALVPALRAVAGKEIRGLVRDAVTKKPLAGANVGAQQGEDYGGWGNSDASGHFSLRVLPGAYKVYLSGAPSGYLRPTSQQGVDTNQDVPEVVFDLKKAVVITGLCVDEAGNPIAAHLTAGFYREIVSDATGKWQTTPEENGPLALGGGEDETGYFEVVGTDKWDAPIKSPVVVKVRKRAWSRLSGRAVAPDGTPLQDIKITASFNVSTGNGGGLGASRSAVSDPQGRFVVSKVRAGRDLKVNGEKSGYTPQNSGKIVRAGADWTTSDLVFAALNRRIEGTTVPGAQVVAAGRETVADATGKFRFDGLPGGEIAVFAAKDGQLGTALSVAGAPLQIVLKKAMLQGRDADLAAKLRDEELTETKGDERQYVEAWLSETDGTPDFEAALQKAARAPAKERYASVDDAISAWKTGDAIGSLQTALEGIENEEIRTSSYLKAALAIPDADLARRALEVATANFKNPSKYLSTREEQLYRTAVITEHVEGAATGATALDRALAFTIQSHGDKTIVTGAMQTETSRDQVMAEHADTVAAGSLALLRRLLEAIEPGGGNDIRALAQAIPTVARVHGPQAALPLLEELKLKPAPQLDAGTPHYLILDPEYAFGSAARALIPLVGAKSPAQALELARRVTSREHRARALASAARFQSGAAAASLWREAVQSANTHDAPRFAAFAWQNDAPLGLELFQIAFKKAEAEMNSPRHFSNAWVPFAFYFARADAAQARLILEREWAKDLVAPQMESYQLAYFPVAMAPLDARRAWAMTRQLPEDRGYSWDFMAREKIARYLVMSDEKRHTLAISGLGLPDAWEPSAVKW